MTEQHTTGRGVLATLLADHRARRAERIERTDLARQMSIYDSANDRTELAAILDRHADADAEAVRSAVDWTRAA